MGKTSLGGVALSPDESLLYVMNLQDRALYALNTSTGAVVVSATVPLTPPLPAGTCTSTNVRPFAVEVFNNIGYIGLTCTGPAATDLRSYIYSFNLTTLAFGATPALQVPLDYARGTGNFDPNIANSTQPAAWNAWTISFAAKPAASTDPNGFFPVYPQPLLTSMAFDADGNIALGMRDRFGDQMGNQVHSNEAEPNVYYYGVPAGDMLRACGNPTNGWTVESNSRCGGTGIGPQNNGQGPGNGEFYWRDEYKPYHDEVSLAGLTQIPGYPDVVSSFYNPIPIDGNSDASFDGGVRWLHNTTGNFTKAYRVYNGTLAQGNLFGKAAGMGDLAILCDAAPLELGNRVWVDTNTNGRQDANENGMGGVIVSLHDVTGTLLVTTTTAADGSYYFAYTDAANTLRVQPNTGYQIRVDTTQAILAGLTPASANYSANTSNDAIADVNDSDGILSGTASQIILITNGPGATNHSFDFGFAPTAQARVSVGNQVWYDSNFDSVLNNNEPGAPGVSVRLYQDTNADCVFSTGDTLITSTVTGPGGYYTFTNLLPTTDPASAYLTVIPGENFEGSGVLVGHESSPGDVGCDVDSNNIDHGTVNGVLGAGGYASSRAITVTVGGEPTDDGDGNPSSNLTLDFGFKPSVVPGTAALGDYVWIDTNNNGLQDDTELGVPDVRVNLYRSGGNSPISTTTTLSNGLYLFDKLAADTYYVEFVKPNNSFGWTVRDAGDNAKDSDADTATGRTTTIPLAIGQTDLTWDAGLVCEANGVVRGTLNARGLFGIPVLLIPVNAPDVATVMYPTLADGSYEFKDVKPGQYQVYVHDAYLNVRDLAPAPGTVNPVTVNVTGCQTQVANFDYENSFGALGDFVWYDINANTLQDEFFDANGDGLVTKNSLDPNNTVPLSAYEWWDINGDNSHAGRDNEGELRKCGLEVASNDLLTLFKTNDLNTVAGGQRTNLFGYYMFRTLDLTDWSVKFKSADANLDAQAKAMFATAKCTPLPGAPPAVDYPSAAQAAANASATSASAAPVVCRVSTKVSDQRVLTENEPLYLDADFGILCADDLAALGDYVWLDTNKNGLQDTGELGVPNVTVTLFSNVPGVTPQVSAAVSATKTNNDGLYLFPKLFPGTYSVQFTLPPQAAFTTRDSGDDAKDSDADTTTGKTIDTLLDKGETDLTWDAGLVCTANGQVSGKLVVGSLSNIPILLLPQNVPGAIALVFPTRADGSFEFKNVPPGKYKLQVHDPTLNQQGYFPAPGSENQIVIVVTGCDTVVANFNYEKSPLGALGDFVWYDINKNALQDEWFDANNDGLITKNTLNPDNVVPLMDYEWYDINGDTSYAGPDNEGELRKCGLEVTTADLLTLYRGDALDTVVGALNTNIFGYYRFNGLALRDWGVNFRSTDSELEAKAKAMFATAKCKPLPGAPPAVDYPSAATAATAQGAGVANANAAPVACGISTKIKDLHMLTVAKPVYLDADFGILCADDLATIGDRVWFDTNRNGIQDQGEPGIVNVPVTLYTSVGTIVSTTRTNEQGLYLFTNLVPGSYYVGFTPPTALVCTAPNMGNDDAADSDANCDTGLTQVISVGPTETNLTLDFGVHPAGPTAITLSSFTALAQVNGGVKVVWHTSLEQNTFGFYVLRSATGKLDDAVAVNAEIVLSKGASGGGEYSIVDAKGAVKNTYWLQEIELDGAKLVYGPTVAQVAGAAGGRNRTDCCGATAGGGVCGRCEPWWCARAGGAEPAASARASAGASADPTSTACCASRDRSTARGSAWLRNPGNRKPK